ncbi:MAG: hypothetical protein AB1Z57_03760 [Acidimicrobiia bacterium]
MPAPMLRRYFARPDAALGADALFGFLLGAAVLAIAQGTGLLWTVSGDVAILIVRLAAGSMLLATFVGGVALGRSVAEVIRAER